MSESRAEAGAVVLVVDDEDEIRRVVRIILEREGYEVIEAGDGLKGLRALFERSPDLVILDVMMPELDGWATLQRIRDVSDVPILMLTARGFETERSRGLRDGADDYVIKPFSPVELTARVAAVLRRAGVQKAPPPHVYDDAFLHIDHAQREVVAGGRPVALTPLEYRLLATLVERRAEVLDRDRLLALVWGDDRTVVPAQVKLYVGYLRRKLGPLPDGTSPILTVRGFGYRYRVPEAPE